MLIEIILWTCLAMLQFISQDMQPIAVVDGSGFHNLIAVAEPRFVVPSRTYFMQIEIPRLYADIKQMCNVRCPQLHSSVLLLTCGHHSIK